MSGEDYQPKGFCAVTIKGRTFLLEFVDREDMVNMLAWLDDRSAKDYLQARTEAITSEVIVTLQDALTAQSNINPLDIHRTANDPPICKKHKTPMEPSTKDIGGWYCKKHDNNGNYCKNFYSSKGKVRNDN